MIESDKVQPNRLQDILFTGTGKKGNNYKFGPVVANSIKIWKPVERRIGGPFKFCNSTPLWHNFNFVCGNRPFVQPSWSSLGVSTEETEQEPTRAEQTGQKTSTAEQTEQEPTRAEQMGQKTSTAEKTEQEPIRTEQTGQKTSTAEKTEQEPTRAEQTGQKTSTAEKTEQEPIRTEQTGQKTSTAEQTEQEPTRAE